MRWLMNFFDRLIDLANSIYMFIALMFVAAVAVVFAAYVVVGVPVGVVWLLIQSVRDLNPTIILVIAWGVFVYYWMYGGSSKPRAQVRRGRNVVTHAQAKQRLLKALKARSRNPAARRKQ